MRLLLVAPIAVLLWQERFALALAVYIVCAGTDVLDGIVARRRGEQTEFGVIMDPLADILSTAVVFAVLLAMQLVPLWVFAILMVRYCSLLIGSIVIFFATGPIRFKATPVGKIVGVLQAVGIMVIIALAASEADWTATWGRFIYPVLAVLFGSVIVSQLIIGYRLIRKEPAHV